MQGVNACEPTPTHRRTPTQRTGVSDRAATCDSASAQREDVAQRARLRRLRPLRQYRQKRALSVVRCARLRAGERDAFDERRAPCRRVNQRGGASRQLRCLDRARRRAIAAMARAWRIRRLPIWVDERRGKRLVRLSTAAPSLDFRLKIPPFSKTRRAPQLSIASASSRRVGRWRRGRTRKADLASVSKQDGAIASDVPR